MAKIVLLSLSPLLLILDVLLLSLEPPRLIELAALALSLPCGSFNFSLPLPSFPRLLRALYPNFHNFHLINTNFNHGNRNSANLITSLFRQSQYSTMWLHPSSRD
jgi:hypothetical protein